jgi:hypothetical protein
MVFMENTQYSEIKRPSQNLTWTDLGFNPGLRGEKSVTNRTNMNGTTKNTPDLLKTNKLSY